MKVNANQLRPGDYIRGLGATVEEVVHGEGIVSLFVRYLGFPEVIPMLTPSDHPVSVRRLFAVGQKVTVSAYAFGDTENEDAFIEAEVTSIDQENKMVGVRSGDLSAMVDFRRARHVPA